MRGFGAYAIAGAMVFSILCSANLALASDATTLSTTIGTAPVGNDLSLIDIGGFLRLLGGFLGIGATMSNASGSGATTFATLPIGGGGYVTGIDIECDQGVGQCSPGVGTVTKVVRTDTAGAWIYNPTMVCGNNNHTGCWQSITTALSMPSSAQGIYTLDSSSVLEIAIAPSNTSHFYMIYADGCLYSSTNKGATWTLTAYTCHDTAGQGTPRLFGPYMAVDPANENIVFAGSLSNGVQYTTNGGTSFTAIPTSTIPGGGGNGDFVVFDRTSSVVGGATQGIYISSNGNGVYHSTNGGSTWSAMSGAPTTQTHMKIDQNGNVWVADNTGNENLWEYKSSTWTEITAAGTGIWNVAINPVNANDVTAVGNGGGLNLSTDGGSTWSGLGYNPPRTAADVPWLQNTNPANSGYLSVGDVAYDPTQSNVMFATSGIGIWYTTPSSNTPTYVSETAALENLESTWLVSPWGSSGSCTVVPTTVSLDRPFFSITSLTSYPSYQGVDDNSSATIQAGWSADWAGQSPANLVGIAGGNIGYTTNCGTTWSFTPTQPLFGSGGSIGIAASTTNNIVFLSGDSRPTYYTTDGGNTWSVMIFPNIANNGQLVTSASGASPLTFSSVPSWLSSAITAGQPYTWNDVSSGGSVLAYGTVTGVSGNTVTTTVSGGTVASGDTIVFIGNAGWGNNLFIDPFQALASDKVNDETFYAVNYGSTVCVVANCAGVYKTTNGGATWTQECSHASAPTTCPATGPYMVIRATPGRAGDVWFTQGTNGDGGGSHPSSSYFWHSTDGGNTWSQPNSNVQEVWTFGFGAPKTMGGYPTLYIYGYADCGQTGITCLSGVPSGFALGVFRSTDEGVTWTEVAGQWPGNVLDAMTGIEGDPNIYGRIYIGTYGQGWQYGQIN